jgi:light-regulated signal transduction histidine kinase (bacteriophytochrome)
MVLTRVYPIKDASGNVVNWVGTSTDITDHKLAEELLEQKVTERTQELEQRNHELERFTYASNHDLQEPVRKIMLFAEMVRSADYKKLSPASQKRFDQMEESAKRLRTALRDVMEYITLDRTEQFSKVDLNVVVADVMSDLELIINEKHAVIAIDTLPKIFAIPQQMHQLFYNLLNNALKFSKSETRPQVQIKSRQLSEEEVKSQPDLQQGRSYYEFSITDNGVGFEMEYAQDIFVMFKRLHTRNVYQGTGIGLSLCERVVHNHHGKIWAVSKLSEGATFKFILPVE